MSKFNEEVEEKQVTKHFPSQYQLDEYFFLNKDLFLEYRMSNVRAVKLDEPNTYTITFSIEKQKEVLLTEVGEIEHLSMLQEMEGNQ